MKIFSVRGYSGSGKTSTIEKIIEELNARGYRVGCVKEIHSEGFAIDADPAADTRRYRDAGAVLVTARGQTETDVLYPRQLAMDKILRLYDDCDWVILEGVKDLPVPLVVTGGNTHDLDARWGEYAFCVSGRVADTIAQYRGVPAFSISNGAKPLVDYLEQMVYDALPGFPPRRCGRCGHSCDTLGLEILRGNASRGDCVFAKEIELLVDGRRVPMVPFVQMILKNTVLGVAKELEGYEEGASVQVRL